ncbi:MAG: hypothetical protein JW934_07560 [Anaerolineae bacterium]|nr:hypothetical protein [Anaerolineae bacterium]
MLNGVRRLWRSFGSLLRGSDFLLASAEESGQTTQPEKAAVPAQDRPESVSRQPPEAIAPGVGLARRIKSCVRPGVLRKVDRALPIRISHLRPPTYHVMPTAMQNVPAAPLPLVKRRPETGLEKAPAGEPVGREAASLPDTATIDATWDALWALRGTLATSARPVPSVPVSPLEQAEPLSEEDAETGIQVAAKPVARPIAPSAQRSVSETTPRPLVPKMPEAISRLVPSPAAAPIFSGELPPPVSRAAATDQVVEPAAPEPAVVERTQTSLPGRYVAPLPAERPEPGALTVPGSDEPAAPARQKMVQPAAPPLVRPVARRGADLPVRPIARRKPGRHTAPPAQPPALPAPSGQRPLSSVQARRPSVDQPRIPNRQETGRPESAAEQVSPPVTASEQPASAQPASAQPVPPVAAKSRPLVASLRASLRRLRVLRRPSEEQPAHAQMPELPTDAAPQPVETEPPVPSLASPRPVARRLAGSALPSPLAGKAALPQAARSTLEQPQVAPSAPLVARPTAAAAPSEGPSSSVQFTPSTLSPRPVARRLMDSVPSSLSADGATSRVSRAAQVSYTVRAPSRPVVESAAPELAVPESVTLESWAKESLPAKVTTAQEPPMVEIAPSEKSTPERVQEPLEELPQEPMVQPSPAAKLPVFLPHGERFTEPPAEGSQPPEPAATWADTQVRPVGTVTVQRTVRDEQDLVQAFQPVLAPATVQTASEILAQPAAAAPQAAGEQERGQAQDIESLSRQVYQIIRRRLTVERERDRGR